MRYFSHRKAKNYSIVPETFLHTTVHKQTNPLFNSHGIMQENSCTVLKQLGLCRTLPAQYYSLFSLGYLFPFLIFLGQCLSPYHHAMHKFHLCEKSSTKKIKKQLLIFTWRNFSHLLALPSCAKFYPIKLIFWPMLMITWSLR